MKSLYRKVDSFDGQIIMVDGKPCYELGGFLGGGAAGVVYEGAEVSQASQVRPVAIKILNPVGFRLAPALTLRRCVVARRGQPIVCGSAAEGVPSASGFSGGPASAGVAAGGATGLVGGRALKLGPEHVWWLVSPNTKQVLAAYIDPRYGSLVEIPLPKCIEIWGLNPRTEPLPSTCGSPNRESRSCAELKEREDNASPGAEVEGGGADPGYETRGFEVQVDGMGVSIPWLPPKFVQWLAQRRKVKREINNMGRVGGHRNVVELLSVLELVQDSKSTLFLILELVTGGELLDHIRLLGEKGGSRAREASALRAEGSTQRYFRQLLSGLTYCHRQGVCHRDLSPSNLLLAESPQGDSPPELKVADFGLSACCALSAPGNENQGGDGARGKHSSRGLPQRVRSIVGSPHYMAPEVVAAGSKGYDGFKADAWSCGVVLYTMLTASLPFDRDLARCPRYKRFKKWAEKHAIGAKPPRPTSPSTGVPSPDAVFPPLSPTSPTAPAPSSPPTPPLWLFPPMIPPPARALLVSLLVPAPSRRMSVEQALSHPWLAGGWGGDGAGNDGLGVTSVSDQTCLSPAGEASTMDGVAGASSPSGGGGAAVGGSAVPSTAAFTGAATANGAEGRGSGPGREGWEQRRSAVGGVGGVGGKQEATPAWKARGDVRGKLAGDETRGVRAGRGGGGGAGKGAAVVGGGRGGGWQGWRADVSPELLSCGSLPSTTSFP